MYQYNDCYPVASIRHYQDGYLLETNKRYDNAMCHYAFSVECSLKTLLNQLNQSNKKIKSHDIEKLLQNTKLFTNFMRIINPKLVLLINSNKPPHVLFDGHPNRRYSNNIPYSVQDIEKSRKYTYFLIKDIINYILNGQIKI